MWIDKRQDYILVQAFNGHLMFTHTVKEQMEASTHKEIEVKVVRS